MFYKKCSKIFKFHLILYKDINYYCLYYNLSTNISNNYRNLSFFFTCVYETQFPRICIKHID